MSENDDELSSLELEEEQSISQVGNRKKPIPMPIIIVFISVVIVSSLLIAVINNSEEKKAIEFTEEKYEVRNTAPPKSPEKPALVIPKPELEQLVNNDELSREELMRQRKEEEMRQRRKHAPVVLINRQESRDDQPADQAQRPRETSVVYPNSGISALTNSATSATERKLAALERASKSALSPNAKRPTQVSFNDLHTDDVVSVKASYLTDMHYKIVQGKVIAGILETAIQSDLPGMLRAIVSDSVYSEDGNQLLIPKGTRLIGEYQSGINEGQVRIFVIWTRLIRPDGINIKMDSPGTDFIGRSGLTGEVDTHFLERFSASIMMSLISGFAQQGTDNDRQIHAISDSFAKSSEIILNRTIDIPPTIHINQGERINIFVNKDLDFKEAMEYKQHLLKIGRL